MLTRREDEPGLRFAVPDLSALNILAGGAPGTNIQRAALKNHTDQELMLIETLVGRRFRRATDAGATVAKRRG